MVYVLEEVKQVAVGKKGNFVVIAELMNPVKYGEKLGIDLTVLESTGEFVVESENGNRTTSDIKELTIVGEL